MASIAAFAGSVDQTSMSTMKLFLGLADRDVPVQRVERRELHFLGFRGGRRAGLKADQAEQRRHQAPGITAAEFGVLVEAGLLDHLEQHAVRGDQAGLALHHHGHAGDVLGTRRELAIDQLKLARVDIELGGGGVAGRHALAHGDGKRRTEECGSGNRDLPPPEQIDELQHVEAGLRPLSRGLRSGPIYRLVVVKHSPQLSFQRPRAEGLLFALRHAPGI
ncbi:hypothetical protein ACVMHW_002648 [Bradyrhizobium diazoefficiens]